METVQQESSQVQLRQVVGRTTELQQLDQHLSAVLQGQRQLVFVTGEPGIGKTTLVDTFVASVANSTDVWIGHGQCIEQYGAGEAYLPILEAINRLCQTPQGERVIAILRQHAPTWLIQLPSLVSEADREALQRHIQGATQERMLRELAEALAICTAQQGLLVVLEDLHWSDTATLDCLAYLARRRESAKLFIIGTYRPADVAMYEHPLKGLVQDLHGRSLCHELPLAPLGMAPTEEYLASRLNEASFPTIFSETIHTRTGGNPLFIVNLVDYLTHRQVLIEQDGHWRLHEEALQTTVQEVPESLRQLIERQIEHTAERDQQILEVASVVGAEFSAAATATGLQTELEEVEEQCDRLARRGHFLQAEGAEEWPDGTLGERYSFRHALYQDVLYHRLSETRRVRLHRRIGLHKEAAYGNRVAEIAAELAVHFERGRDIPKAIQYLELAGHNALQRSAGGEAVRYLQSALAKLSSVPHTPARDQQELSIQIKLGTALMVVRSWSVPEVGAVYERARTLCQQLDQPDQLFQVLAGLRLYHLVRAEFAIACEVSQQLLHLAEQQDDPSLLVEAHHSLGSSFFWLGECQRAKNHLEQALAVYDPQQHESYTLRYGQDPGISALSYLILLLWHLGYPDQALKKSEEALTLARRLGHPFTLVNMLCFSAWLHQRCAAPQAVARLAAEATQLCTAYGFFWWSAACTFAESWAQFHQGQQEAALPDMRHSMSDSINTQAEAGSMWLRVLLVDAYRQVGHIEAGLSLLEEAAGVIAQRGKHFLEAELSRLKGELLLLQDKGEEAEQCFQTALAIAQQQQAKSWELRAATSLGRLWQTQGKTDKARELLEGVYSWFTEGFETHDVQQAEALLKMLGSCLERNTAPAAETEEAAEQSPTPPLPSSRPQQLSALPQPVTAPPSSISDQPEQPPSVLAQHPSQSSSPNPQPSSTFRHEGDYWTVVFAGTECRLKDLRGMHYLAQLLTHPNEEFHVLALSTGKTQPSEATPSTLASRHAAADSEAFQVGFTDAGELLDPQARAAYRQRVQELQTELEEAHAFNDLGRVERLQEELDFLSQELSQAVGLGGRARRTNSPAERARTTVAKAIKAVIKRITAVHPELGQHLSQTIRTGTYCVYAADPTTRHRWQS